jgi:hypothetical protein
LTTPRLTALQEEWRANPPAHWLIAALIGYKPPSKPESVASARRHTTLAALQAALGDGGR